MANIIIERLSKLVDEGEAINDTITTTRWASKVKAFLAAINETDESHTFANLSSNESWHGHAIRMGYLQGLLAKFEKNAESREDAERISKQSEISTLSEEQDPRKVFVVHGHDNEAKETAARFIEKLGLQPIILHEQPNSGRTIIEKFESYSGDIAFAVILLTPDDVGSVATDPPDLQPRARQNVILELGYFMGKLSRLRVCALYKGGIELPSDYQGILYIEMDSKGAWRSKIAQEFVEAKLSINIEALLGG